MIKSILADGVDHTDYLKAYCPPKYDVPRDKDGFVQSFAHDDAKGYKAFFEKFGFVVVHGVLSKEECAATIDEIWSILGKKGFKRSDPSGWDSKWQTTGLADEGIIGVDPLFWPRALTNRQNTRLYKVCCELYGREDLICNQDRYGFFRPTKSVTMTDGRKVDKAEWSTWRNLHLDMNPFGYVELKDSTAGQALLSRLEYRRAQDFITENNQVGVMADNQLHIQGLFNLADNKEEDGGFQIVPGFKHHLVEFTQKRAELKARFGTRQTFCVMPENEPAHKVSIRVTARAGSIVLWDQRTLHGSRPNESSCPRYAQFFKMFPAHPMDATRARLRCEAVTKNVKACGFDTSTLTQLGRRILGLELWPAPANASDVDKPLSAVSESEEENDSASSSAAAGAVGASAKAAECKADSKACDNSTATATASKDSAAAADAKSVQSQSIEGSYKVPGQMSQARTLLESELGISFVERESAQLGGAFLLAETSALRRFKLIRNRESATRDPVFPELNATIVLIELCEPAAANGESTASSGDKAKLSTLDRARLERLGFQRLVDAKAEKSAGATAAGRG